MLVLSRKVGERIVVGESGVSVTVIDIRGNRVRVGITAPPDTPVFRKELTIRRRLESPGQSPCERL